MKTYNNPEFNITDIKTNSIIAASSSRQSPSTIVKNTESNLKPSSQTKITYDIVGEDINIYIPMETGVRRIQEKAVIVPGGDKCIVYNGYIYTMKQFAQNATDIPYYIDKMQQALNFKNKNVTAIDIILKMASNHISFHGRIIDGDLSMIISAIAKVTGQNLDTDLEWSGMDVVLKNYRDKVFFTRYVFGTEPTLIPATEY